MQDATNFREDIAWAAGLFEGEGCVRIRPRGCGEMTLAMTDRDVVERFAEIVGAGKVKRNDGPARNGHQVQWRWNVSRFETVQAVVAMIWPWLGERRRAKALEVLTIAKTRGLRNSLKTHCPQGHPYDAANTYYGADGSRRCSQCVRDLVRRRRLAAKEA